MVNEDTSFLRFSFVLRSINLSSGWTKAC